MLTTPYKSESVNYQLPALGDVTLSAPGNDNPIEGDWNDEDDEDFDDRLDAINNLDIPSPEDDDHLPDDDLQ
jgi:hypothetical protein